MLLKMAAQLNAFDEASLMVLWEKMAEEVENFEPTKRWEEHAIALGMIQSLHMKNQLFNYQLAKISHVKDDAFDDTEFLSLLGKQRPFVDTKARNSQSEAQDEQAQKLIASPKCKVLTFKPRD